MRQVARVFLSTFVLLLITSFARAQEASRDTLKEIQRQIEILTQEIERMKLGEVSETRYEPSRGLGPAAAKVYQLKKAGVSLAGYGEVVYENYATKREDDKEANKLDKIDYLRNVLYVGFRFSHWIVFNSELEIEHASTGKGGEVSIEFGYIDLMISKHFNVRAGMVLPPLGIINEKHEPSTFFGTQRPAVERSIIPSTWRTNGIGLYGELLPSLNYRAYVVEGLNAAKFTDTDGIRSGRQSGGNAVAEDFALTGKLEFDGVPGATLGVSFYTGNSGQGVRDSLGEISAATNLWSVHGECAWKSLELRALYARCTIEDAGRVSKLAGKTIGSTLNGWYIVAGYDVIPLIAPGSEHYLAPFVQYEQLNTQAFVPSGYSANKTNDRSAFVAGVTYKPHPNVAFKFDYRDNRNKAKTGVSQWNLALNYLF
jgi:hypothetical protein